MKKLNFKRSIVRIILNSWFPCLTLTICVTNITRIAQIQVSELLFAMIILCITSLATIGREKMLKRLKRIYSEQMSVVMLLIMRYLCGTLAILYSFILI